MSGQKLNTATVIGLALVLFLASCGGGAESPTPVPISATSTASPSPAEPTVPLPALLTPVATRDQGGELRLWLSWDGHDLDAFGRVVELFAEEYPSITPRITYVPEDQMLETLVNAPEGTGPTVFFAASSSAPILWEAGHILDMSENIPSELHASLQLVAWSQAVFEGKVVGVPLAMEGVLLFRNRELAPSRAATVDELVTTAMELRNQGTGIGASLDFAFIYSASRLLACDGTIFAPDGSMGFAGDAGRCWLELERRLSEAGRVVFNGDEDLDLFASGQSAWLIELSTHVPELEEAIGEGNLAIDAWPDYEETGMPLEGFVWTENAYFPTGMTQAEMDAAWAFVSFMLTPQVQLILADPQGAWHMPVLARLDLEDGLQIQTLGALLNGLPLPMNPTLWRAAGSLENAVRLVAQQGAEPLLALSVLVAELSPILPTPLPTPEN
jgi:arabinogalactan oligomer/maltooligosaccharide transport system substrate-binding protein